MATACPFCLHVVCRATVAATGSQPEKTQNFQAVWADSPKSKKRAVPCTAPESQYAMVHCAVVPIVRPRHPSHLLLWHKRNQARHCRLDSESWRCGAAASSAPHSLTPNRESLFQGRHVLGAVPPHVFLVL